MSILVKDIFRSSEEFADKKIKISGWIRTIRVSKNFGFVELNDGSFFKNIQIIIEAEKLDNFVAVSKLNVGASITAEGTLVMTPGAQQPFELKADEVIIEGESTPDYPLQKKDIPLNICVQYRT